MTTIEEALIEIASFFEHRKIPYMIIGGVANAFWGVPRSTVDIDVTIKVDDGDIEAFIKELSPPEIFAFYKSCLAKMKRCE